MGRGVGVPPTPPPSAAVYNNTRPARCGGGDGLSGRNSALPPSPLPCNRTLPAELEPFEPHSSSLRQTCPPFFIPKKLTFSLSQNIAQLCANRSASAFSAVSHAFRAGFQFREWPRPSTSAQLKLFSCRRFNFHVENRTEPAENVGCPKRAAESPPEEAEESGRTRRARIIHAQSWMLG